MLRSQLTCNHECEPEPLKIGHYFKDLIGPTRILTSSLIYQHEQLLNHGAKPARFDTKEQFWMHAYNDLSIFITYYQKNDTGKPIKAMQAELENWSPTFNVQRATNENRFACRSSTK